jgi:hypothetical protein
MNFKDRVRQALRQPTKEQFEEGGIPAKTKASNSNLALNWDFECLSGKGKNCADKSGNPFQVGLSSGLSLENFNLDENNVLDTDLSANIMARMRYDLGMKDKNWNPVALSLGYNRNQKLITDGQSGGNSTNNLFAKLGRYQEHRPATNDWSSGDPKFNYGLTANYDLTNKQLNRLGVYGQHGIVSGSATINPATGKPYFSLGLQRSFGQGGKKQYKEGGGGFVRNAGGGDQIVYGPTHEQGGVNRGPDVELEGGGFGPDGQPLAGEVITNIIDSNGNNQEFYMSHQNGIAQKYLQAKAQAGGTLPQEAKQHFARMNEEVSSEGQPQQIARQGGMKCYAQGGPKLQIGDTVNGVTYQGGDQEEFVARNNTKRYFNGGRKRYHNGGVGPGHPHEPGDYDAYVQNLDMSNETNTALSEDDYNTLVQKYGAEAVNNMYANEGTTGAYPSYINNNPDLGWDPFGGGWANAEKLRNAYSNIKGISNEEKEYWLNFDFNTKQASDFSGYKGRKYTMTGGKPVLNSSDTDEREIHDNTLDNIDSEWSLEQQKLMETPDDNSYNPWGTGVVQANLMEFSDAWNQVENSELVPGGEHKIYRTGYTHQGGGQFFHQDEYGQPIGTHFRNKDGSQGDPYPEGFSTGPLEGHHIDTKFDERLEAVNNISTGLNVSRDVAVALLAARLGRPYVPAGKQKIVEGVKTYGPKILDKFRNLTSRYSGNLNQNVDKIGPTFKRIKDSPFGQTYNPFHGWRNLWGKDKSTFNKYIAHGKPRGTSGNYTGGTQTPMLQHTPGSPVGFSKSFRDGMWNIGANTVNLSKKGIAYGGPLLLFGGSGDGEDNSTLNSTTLRNADENLNTNTETVNTETVNTESIPAHIPDSIPALSNQPISSDTSFMMPKAWNGRMWEYRGPNTEKGFKNFDNYYDAGPAE